MRIGQKNEMSEEESTIESRSKKVLAGEISLEQWEEKEIIKSYEEAKKEMGPQQPTKKEIRRILEETKPEEEIDEEIFDKAVKIFRKKVMKKGKYILFDE